MKNIYIIIIALIILIPFLLSAQNTTFNDADILDEAYLKFNTPDSTQRNQLATALEAAITLHPNSGETPNLVYKLILLYQEMDAPRQALFNAFKLIIIYGESPLAAAARNSADSILTENLSTDFLPQQPELINTVFGRPAQRNFRLAYLDFISFLHAVSIPALDRLTLMEIDLYKRFFDKEDNNDFDAVLSWQADICLRQGLYTLGWIALQRLSIQYPNSSFAASGYLRLAHLALERFHDPIRAKQILLDLINQLPESPSTAEAQYLLAQIFDYNLEKKKEALANYLVLIKAFPDCPFRADAMLRSGELYSESKEYDNALATYMQIVEDYDRAPQVSVALQRIIYLDRKVFNNPQRVSSNLLLLAQLFPERPDRPSLLLQAATLLLKLKKKTEGIQILRQIIKNYPRTKEAQSANKRLKKN